MIQAIHKEDHPQGMSVAYLGPEATFSHQAVVSLFGDTASFHGAESIEDVFEWVETDRCQRGVVPIENSYEGAIHMTLDLFYQYNLVINGEIFLRVRHHLLGRGDGIEAIQALYSHPMPIAQCRSWIKTHLSGVPVITVGSTSLAAKKAVLEPDKAAIGSRFAGQTYGLKTLAPNIEDHPNNVTRFFIIGKDHTAPTGKDKTSLLFLLQHKPGMLFKALGALAERHINMTRIESRPMKVKNWEYMFFVDIEGHEHHSDVAEALVAMENQCVFLKRLGSYPVGAIPQGASHGRR
jgi:chorismate mutase/prephenate dehydratase